MNSRRKKNAQELCENAVQNAKANKNESVNGMSGSMQPSWLSGVVAIR